MLSNKRGHDERGGTKKTELYIGEDHKRDEKKRGKRKKFEDRKTGRDRINYRWLLSYFGQWVTSNV